MGKDHYSAAAKDLSRAELLYNADEFKRAFKSFNAAGNKYLKVGEYKAAEDCFFNAYKSLTKMGKHDLRSILGTLRDAGDAALIIDQFSDANHYFKKALNHISDVKKSANRDLFYTIFSTLSYLCLFTEGKQDEGLALLKQVKKNIDDTYFKENKLISLVKNLTIAIRDKNKKYLDKVELDFEKYNFNEAEEKLLKEVLVVAKSHIYFKTELSLDRDQYTTRDIIKLTLNVDTSPLIKISKDPFYSYNIKDIKITNLVLDLSENITTQKKPNLPVKLRPGEKYDFIYEIKPHFQIDKPFIGPVLLTYELDDKFIFLLQEKQILIPNLISPPPSLDISMKNLKPPLIGQSFPMEFFIENNSEGDALELELNVEFPKELKLIRGTAKKQIYSLSSKDNMKWEISLKPIEAGDYNIKMDIKFKDPDQNQIEENRVFPFSVKL